MSHCNVVQGFIPMPQSMTFLDAKAAVDREWTKLETIPAWNKMTDKQLMQFLPILSDNGRMLPDCSKLLSRYVQTFGYVFHDKWPKSWANMEDLVLFLERILYGHPVAGLFWWERAFEKSLRTWMGESTKLGMYVRSSKTRVISVCICG